MVENFSGPLVRLDMKTALEQSPRSCPRKPPQFSRDISMIGKGAKGNS
jgi:hypothetical protein